MPPIREDGWESWFKSHRFGDDTYFLFGSGLVNSSHVLSMSFGWDSEGKAAVLVKHADGTLMNYQPLTNMDMEAPLE